VYFTFFSDSGASNVAGPGVTPYLPLNEPGFRYSLSFSFTNILCFNFDVVIIIFLV